MIRNIRDPEHPLSLEQLNVVQTEHIWVDDLNPTSLKNVKIEFTPTVPHCSMATLIGLCIRVKLLRELPLKFKVAIKIREGTHSTEEAGMKSI